MDLAGRRVHVRDTEVHLTRTEFDLVAALAVRLGQVVERDVLLAEVWQWQDPVVGVASTRTVDSHVKALRRKIGPERVRTVHGVGYALEAMP